MNFGMREEGEPWLFDDFEEGAALGTVDIAIDHDRMALWNGIYGDAGEATIPQGLIAASMMEAYLRVIPRRPPGNIHASQKLDFTGDIAQPGARLTFEFACLEKTRRRERGWVTLSVRCRDGERDLMNGEIQTIWAR